MRDFEPPPEEGSTVWCDKCADWRKVLRLVEGWSVRCEGCRYGRFFGTMQHAAGRAQGRHKEQHPNHSVVLYLNGKVEHRLGNVAVQTLALGLPGLDNDGSEIPF